MTPGKDQAVPWSRVLTPGVLAGFLAVLVVLVVTLVAGLANLRNLYTASEAIEHTYAVKASLEQLLATLVDAETGERGFIITGTESYLEPYDRARSELASVFVQVRALTADNPDQQADLDRLSALTDVKLSELAAAIEQQREGGFAAAQSVVATNLGKRTMDDMRAIVARMESREDDLLAVRTAETDRSYQVARLTGYATTGLALLMVIVLFAATYRHDAERQRAAQTSERLAVTLASIGDAVIATDDQGRVLHMNAVAEHLTGWTEAEATGHPLEDVFVIVNEHTRQPTQSPVGRVLREGVIVGLANHTVLMAKDGREIPVDDSAAPIRDVRGTVIGVVMVFRDVIERRRVERERMALLESERAARSEAEAAVKTRDEFLSIASHELRNPVNAVQLQLAGVLREVNRGEAALERPWLAERIGHASTQVHRLTHLIDNLLDVSRITAGALMLEPEEHVDFREIVRAAVNHFGDQLKPGQAILRLPQEPVDGHWDPVRLDQVVTNLLSNAIKYGNGKPIELTLRTEHDHVHFSIADRGIGIEPDQQQRLFGRFERAVSGRQYGGFGLGLWITERIVHAMHGTIGVESRSGEGSTFSVVLPRRVDTDGRSS